MQDFLLLLMRYSFILGSIALVLLLTKFVSKTRYRVMVPVLSSLIFFSIVFIYQFIWRLEWQFRGDEYLVFTLYFDKGLKYGAAVGYSDLIFFVAQIFNISLYNSMILIGLILSPFIFYFVSFFLFKQILSFKDANLATFMFLCLPNIFSTFLTGIKDNLGLIIIISGLNLLIIDSKENIRKKYILNICFLLLYLLLSYMHLASFVIGSIIFFVTIEFKTSTLNNKLLTFNPLYYGMIAIVVFTIFYIYGDLLYSIINILILHFLIGYLNSSPFMLFKLFSEFLTPIHTLISEEQYLLGFCIGLLILVFIMFIKLIFLLPRIISSIKRKFRSIQKLKALNYNKTFLIISLIISVITWGFYSLLYYDYILEIYSGLFAYILIQSVNILMYSISFFSIITYFFDLNRSFPQRYQFYLSHSALVSFFLFLTSAIMLLMLLSFMITMGNAERRFLRYLYLFQVILIMILKNYLFDKKRTVNKVILNLGYFLICFLSLMLGTMDELFYQHIYPL